jgi:MFS transporter, DHA2 family, multidrug resistance protein
VDAPRRPAINPYIIAISVMLATFMEVLDTTIVNVAIPHVSGNLGATYEEGTWVVTSYLVSNAIILPMSGWLAAQFGRRRLLLLCVAGFTITSVLCGAATSLSWLIFFRVMQGVTGGGLQPLAQAVLLESFPPEKHGQAMAFYGLGVVIAPILGPTLGGFITDHYSWRWVFYINVPFGLLSLYLMSRFVHDPEYLRHKIEKRVDLWGIGLLAVGLGTLQVILDTGQRKDWFGHIDIRILTIFCVVGLIAFIIRELMVDDPIVDLRALKDRSFAIGTGLMTFVGFTLYGSLVILPMYLENLLGYPALQAGLVLSPRGLGSLIAMPVVGVLTSKYDARKLLAFGFTLGAFTMWQLSSLNLNAGYWDVFWPQVLQGAAMGCMFIPLSAAAVSHIAKQKMGNATSIFNLMRNIGGSVGIALMTTFLARRSQFHHNHLVARVTPYDPTTQQMFQQFRSYFISIGSDAATATQRAWMALDGMVERHAAMLAFVEAFWVNALIFMVMIPFAALLANPHERRAKAALRLARENGSLKPGASVKQPEEAPELVLH